MYVMRINNRIVGLDWGRLSLRRFCPSVRPWTAWNAGIFAIPLIARWGLIYYRNNKREAGQ